MRAKHHVYVVELSKDVLYEAKFIKSNPGYVTGKPCVYVGMTGLDPDLRFDNTRRASGPTSTSRAMGCV